MESTSVEIWAFAASFASVLLAILAMVLSALFYNWSAKNLSSTKEVQRDIQSAVARLEKVFDSLYADTFSMMKDTVTDMRRHVWPSKDDQATTDDAAEVKVQEQFNELEQRYDNRMLEVLDRQEMTEEKIAALSTELRHVISDAIKDTKRVGESVAEESAEAAVRSVLRRNESGSITAGDVVSYLAGDYAFATVVNALDKLRDEGVVHYSTAGLGPSTTVSLV